MPVLRDHRLEHFLREYLKLGVASEAWRKVYPPGKFHCARAASARAMARPSVRARYNELVERQMKRSDITVDKVLEDYQWAILSAKAQDKPGEVVAAATAQAKLVGLLRERVEAGNVGDFGDVTDISTVLEVVAKEISPQAALALKKAFNIGESEEPGVDLEEARPVSDAVN